MRYGITLPTSGVPLAEMRAWVREVADAGYTDLWLGESVGADAVALLAMAAVLAPSLHLGTAVLPASTRAPGLLAMSAATLAGLAPGRVSIGIGASSPTVVSDWGGVTYSQPVARTRDVVRFLKRALRGERITAEFDTFSVRGFALHEAPASVPPVLVAGLQPGMLRMAAREADGAVLTLVCATDVARVRSLVGPQLPLVTWLMVCPYTTDSSVQAREAARRLLAGYLTVPSYAAAAAWHGRANVLEGMLTEWAAGRRREAATAIPDHVVDDLVIHGDPSYCRERIEEFREAGVDVPLLSVLPLDADVMSPLRLLAP